MAITGNFIPTLSSDNVTKGLLDMVYRHNALLLDDAISLIGGSFIGGLASAPSIPLPLVGFVYETPSTVELLKYSYSEYPYLNKSLIINSYLRENTQFRVVAYRQITASNPVILNIATNEILYKTLETYCNNGGTFTLLTMWGTFNNLVLEGLNGIMPNDEIAVGGCGFEFLFRQIAVSTCVIDKIFVTAFSKLTHGLVLKIISLFELLILLFILAALL